MKCKYCAEDDERDRLGYGPKYNICECSRSEKIKNKFFTLLKFLILLIILFLSLFNSIF